MRFADMKIVTTPMCQEILRLAGVQDFTVMKDTDSAGADVAVVLSETNTNKKSIKIKLNTFSQINDSIKTISDMFGTQPMVSSVGNAGVLDSSNENRKIKVKVYSNFLKDIVEDLGFTVVHENDDQNTYDFLVYPDYMKDEITNKIKLNGFRVVEIPSHKNVPLNPIKRAELRYNILEKKLCMKL
jgi:segregation and condensation protein B